MYTAYAAIYDLARQGCFGNRMAHWTLDWLAGHGQPPRRVLDLACGTGAATLVFAQVGCQVTGVDQSREMLAIARAKARDVEHDIELIEADIREIGVSSQQRIVGAKQFDLATCFADSLNYLTQDGDLERVFISTAVVLRSGGYLVFDMNTEAEYATWDERDVVAYDSGDLVLYQKLKYNRRTRLGTGKIGWFVREIDRWWRGEETHIQRAWGEIEIRAALQTAGFALVLAQPVEGSMNGRRSLYIARKN